MNPSRSRSSIIASRQDYSGFSHDIRDEGISLLLSFPELLIGHQGIIDLPAKFFLRCTDCSEYCIFVDIPNNEEIDIALKTSSACRIGTIEEET